MMNLEGTTGESSCKRQENGDLSIVTERPLKKARFAWQVKGKYHLKNETPSTSTSCSQSVQDADKASSSSENESDCADLVGKTEQNLEILGDYLLKQDFNALDSVINDAGNSLHKPSTSLLSDTLQYPRYVSTGGNNIGNGSTDDMDQMEYTSWPMSMVMTQKYAEDQCIARWQARQMAKGFVDNTINRVLDSWMTSPVATEMDDNRVFAMDVAEFINNLPEDNSIENEGILMAISAHGLQNNSSASSSHDDSNDVRNSHSVDVQNDKFLSPPSSPLISNEETTNEHLECKLSASEESYKDLDLTWPYKEESNSDSFKDTSTLSPYLSSSSYQCISDNQSFKSTNVDGDQNDKSSDDSIIDHFDFLDAAVSFAIQNKGLTSFGTDYG